MIDLPLGLNAAEVSRLYEQTLGAEYARWVVDWRLRTGDTTHLSAVIGGDEAGPAAVVAGPGRSYVLETLGIGFDGLAPDLVIDRAEDIFCAAGSHRGLVELSPYANQAYVSELSRRGFRYDHALHVFVAEVRSVDRAEAERDDGLRIELVDPEDEQAVDDAARAVVQGKLGLTGNAMDAEALVISRMVVSCRSVATYVAVVDDEIAGGASIGVWEGHPLSPSHANLYGAGTKAAYRGRGIQTALMRARLRWAEERGAVTVSMDCRPGVASERNAARLGFGLRYTKPVFCRAYVAKSNG